MIVKSFARIHETNLKKQGVLALIFSEPGDYEKIEEDDRLAIKGLKQFAPGGELCLEITHSNGEVQKLGLQHTYNREQIKWFQAGSALNLLRQQDHSTR